MSNHGEVSGRGNSQNPVTGSDIRVLCCACRSHPVAVYVLRRVNKQLKNIKKLRPNSSQHIIHGYIKVLYK
ncbi:hypothetical protein AB205_0142430 [Aquarana catesbeiana]|uniref:Uncharacterized protein n=1 Tax=Aquarana catesbeiana TaxID=8400 RepID=A0A2G9R549_AQUCT|nr:hypothetical protein AB205_0142430 [Aquarana catesbeiana]